MTIAKLGVVVPLALLIVACQPQKYYWGDYSSSLYGYYSDPKTQADYEKTLVDVTSSERIGKKVPPGLFAEAGYMELTHGNVDRAIVMFQREKQAWPESAIFMDKAISAAKAGSKPAAAGKDTKPTRPDSPTS